MANEELSGFLTGLNNALAHYLGNRAASQQEAQQKKQDLQDQLDYHKQLIDYQYKLSSRNTFQIPMKSLIAINPELGKMGLDPNQMVDPDDIEKVMKLSPSYLAKKGGREAAASGSVFPVEGLTAYFPDNEEAARMQKEFQMKDIRYIPRELIDGLRDKIYGTTNSEKELFKNLVGPLGLQVTDPVTGERRAATVQEGATAFADFQDTLKRASKGKTIDADDPEIKDMAARSVMAYEKLTDDQKMGSGDALRAIGSRLAKKGYSAISIKRILTQAHDIGWNAHFDGQGNVQAPPSLINQLGSGLKSMLPSFMLKGGGQPRPSQPAPFQPAPIESQSEPINTNPYGTQ